MELIKQYWQGKKPLYKAFWYYYVLLGMIVGLFAQFIGIFIMISSFMKMQAFALTLTLPYYIFSWIVVWRCSNNSRTLWKVLARSILIFGALLYAAGLIAYTSLIGTLPYDAPITYSFE